MPSPEEEVRWAPEALGVTGPSDLDEILRRLLHHGWKFDLESPDSSHRIHGNPGWEPGLIGIQHDVSGPNA